MPSKGTIFAIHCDSFIVITCMLRCKLPNNLVYVLMERCWIAELGKSLFLEKFRGFSFEWSRRRYSSNQIAAAFVELYFSRSIPALFIGS